MEPSAKRSRHSLAVLGRFRNASISVVQEILHRVRQHPEILDAAEPATAYKNACDGTLY